METPTLPIAVPVQKHQYDTLAIGDIRILHLLPGRFDDAIRIEIEDIKFQEPEKKPRTRLNRRDLRRTLPTGWEVYENLEGRFIFGHPELDNGAWGYTWQHPDLDFDPSLYAGCSDEERETFKEPSYEALSYAWSDEHDPKPVFVTSKDKRAVTRLVVTRNLESALQHLRYEDRPRTMWIDAICINQADNEEKSHQVRQMAKIYTLAHRVIAWLGAEQNNSSIALNTLEYLGKQVEYTLQHYICFKAIGAQEQTWWDESTELDYGEDLWSAISSLLSREWFARLWVIQEIAFAKSNAILHCGMSKVPWAYFRRALECLFDKKKLPTPAVIKSVHFAHKLGIAIRKQQAFGALLRIHRMHLCSDYRDKVYGLLGIAAAVSPRIAAAIVPNYSTEVAEVYKQTFLSHIRHVRRWESFGSDWSDRGPHLPKSTPSWVPDLASPYSKTFNSLWQWSSGHSELEFTYHEPNILEVVGLYCATVHSVGARAPIMLSLHDELSSSFQSTCQSWIPDKLQNAIYPTGETVLDAYARTLLQGCFNDRVPKFGVPTLEEWKASPDFDCLFGRDPSRKVEFHAYFGNKLRLSCSGRHFMTTDKGYIGLGPAGVAPGTCIKALPLSSDSYLKKSFSAGDIIVVFLGCERPMVLRPQSDGQHILLGDSFVYGLSDAAAFLGPLEKPWTVRVDYHPDSSERYMYMFVNSETGESTFEDPRLKPHPDWERINPGDTGRDLNCDDPENCDFFRHKETGEIRNSDPRWLPEALEQRHMELVKFRLA